ncbi:MAG TPA: hypothetical protein VFX07_06870, partial [Candidatus Udaeobacter sp.]|nr:hypothetical protein [Candidatus Udaeobacter sp.]
WLVPEWGQPQGFEDLEIDSDTGHLYASSGNMNTVLIFDLNGTKTGNLIAKPPTKFETPAGLVVRNGKLYVLNMSGNRVSVLDL